EEFRRRGHVPEKAQVLGLNITPSRVTASEEGHVARGRDFAGLVIQDRPLEEHHLAVKLDDGPDQGASLLTEDRPPIGRHARAAWVIAEERPVLAEVGEAG